ncbi:hypothetical protein X769_32895 [Mesorhizobium sp. LSJC268A00]|nr:hypothetical protein X769_32895 [Mesorhizobium sp. LSJC268A00]
MVETWSTAARVNYRHQRETDQQAAEQQLE